MEPPGAFGSPTRVLVSTPEGYIPDLNLRSLLIIVLTAFPLGAQEPPPVTVLFLGDSITAGYGLANPDRAFPGLLQARSDSLGYHATLVNAGLSGETSSGGLRRIDWLLRRPIDILVLELGANDGLRGVSLDLTKQNLLDIVKKSKAAYPHLRVIIAGMQVPPNLGETYAATFRQMFPDIARETETDLIPFLLEHVGGHPDLNLADGKHPNVEGHRIIAETVWPILERHLRDLSDSSP